MRRLSKKLLLRDWRRAAIWTLTFLFLIEISGQTRVLVDHLVGALDRGDQHIECPVARLIALLKQEH
jgi:hypothetical protein